MNRYIKVTKDLIGFQSLKINNNSIVITRFNSVFNKIQKTVFQRNDLNEMILKNRNLWEITK